MGKFNTKSKTVVVPVATNEMGEKAYVLSAKEELVSTILTTFLSDSYYEKERDIVKRIISAADKCDPLFVAKAAVYARQEANMRSVSHLLAGHLAKRVAGREWGSRFYYKIIGRPDDIGEILGYVKKSNAEKGIKMKITNAMKKAFRKYLSGLDPYRIDKYKGNGKDFSMKSLLKLLHPTPTQKNETAFNHLINGKSLSGLYESKILEKEMTKAGQLAKDKKEENQVDEYKGDAIASVLLSDKGMPIMNLLRNLRNILLYSPDLVDEACKQLTNHKKLEHSKLLPFRFAAAYTEIEKMKISSKASVSKSVVFESDKKKDIDNNENINKVLSAIEEALMVSVSNIPKLQGSTAILIDHSGSVRGDAGGSSKVSAFSKVNTAMIGNLFGSMMLYSQDNCYLGMFGDRLVSANINRDMGVLDFNQATFKLGEKCGGGTENGLYIFLDKCIREGTKIDNLIIFSDMVIGAGGAGGWDHTSYAGLGSFQKLFMQFKKLNPLCNTYSINIRQTSGKSVFDKSLRVTQIDGWSDKIFDLMQTNNKGYDQLIKEIESIVI